MSHLEVITTHINADFDALASMVAAKKLYPDAVMVFPGSQEPAVRSFLSEHALGIARLKDVDCAAVGRLILVDTHRADRIGRFGELLEAGSVPIHVYDHHPIERLEGRIEKQVVEYTGATITLLVELLRRQGTPITPFEATMFALGVYEETGSLTFPSTTPRELDVVAFLLRSGADLTMVSDYLHVELSPRQMSLFSALIQSQKLYEIDGVTVVIAGASCDHDVDDVAGIVHKLCDMRHVDVIIALIGMQGKIQLVVRSRSDAFNAGTLAKLFGGGGHSQAAAACIRGRPLLEVEEQIQSVLTEWYHEAHRARDLMTTPVQTVPVDASVRETEHRLTTGSVNALPVVDTSDRLLGIVTREIIQKALLHGLDDTPIHDVMRTDLYTAEPTTPFGEVSAHMIEANQRIVPVLDSRIVVGVISRTDLLRMMHKAIRTRPVEGDVRSPVVRNVRRMLKNQLPERIYTLLHTIGECAERRRISVYAVGGFVRDLMLRIPNLDIDIVVEADAIAFSEDFANACGARVVVHERFGTTVVVFPDRFKIDVATARTESYAFPSALPTVKRSSIKQDLHRRDFTINTLAVRLDGRAFGTLVDYYGGQRDLKARVVRVLHSLSFVDDPTRAFRAVRFEQRYGFHINAETQRLIQTAVRMDVFRHLSGHRLLEEWIDLFSEAAPERTLERLEALDLLSVIHPKLRHAAAGTLWKNVERALSWYRLLFLERPVQVWLLYLIGLLDALTLEDAEQAVERLGLSKRHSMDVRVSKRDLPHIISRFSAVPEPRPAEVYRSLHPLQTEVLLFLMATLPDEPGRRLVSQYLTSMQSANPIVTGRDLSTLGLKPGPIYREILEEVRDARLNGEVSTLEDELNLVKRYLREHEESGKTS